MFISLPVQLSSYNNNLNLPSEKVTTELLTVSVSLSKPSTSPQNYSLTVNYSLAQKPDLEHKKRLNTWTVEPSMSQSIPLVNKSDNNNFVSPVLNKVFNFNRPEKYSYIISDLTKKEKTLLEILSSYIDYETGRILISKMKLAYLGECHRSTVTRLFAKLSEHKMAKLGEQHIRKNGTWSPCEDYLNLKDFTVMHFMRHSSLREHKERERKHTCIPPTLEKDKFKDIRKPFYYPTTQQGNDELVEKGINHIFKATEKEIKAITGSANYIPAWKDYQKRVLSKLPNDYWVKRTKSLFWTIESMSWQFLADVKYTQKMKFIKEARIDKNGKPQTFKLYSDYQASLELQDAEKKGLIRRYDSDKANSHIEINNRRLKEALIEEPRSFLPFQVKVNKVTQRSTEETLALLEACGGDLDKLDEILRQ